MLITTLGMLGVAKPFFASLAASLAMLMGVVHSGLPEHLDRMTKPLVREEERFTRTLPEALRRSLGEHVEQYGSLAEGDRLLLDFPHAGQLTQEDLAVAEAEVYSQELAQASVNSDAEAYFVRGNAKDDLGLHEEAIEDYGEAIRLDPGYAAAYNNRGNAMRALGLYEEAIEDYDEAIRLDSGYARAYNNRASTKFKLEQYEGTVSDYDEAIGLDPGNAEAYSKRGVAKSALGMHEEAIKDFDEALDIKFDYAEAYFGMGMAYIEIGEKGKAKRALEKCMSLSKRQGIKYLEDLARLIIRLEEL